MRIRSPVIHRLWSLCEGSGCVKNEVCSSSPQADWKVILWRGGRARCCCALVSGCCPAGDPWATTARQVLFLHSWQHHSTCILISQCQTVSQALSAAPSRAQHKRLPAAGSLGYHYQPEPPDVTLLCSRQAETLTSAGTSTCSDQDISSPGRGGFCAPVTLSGAPRLHCWWQHRWEAELLEMGVMKGKMVAGVAGIILVIHVIGKDEFVHILCENIACLLGCLVCNFWLAWFKSERMEGKPT